MSTPITVLDICQLLIEQCPSLEKRVVNAIVSDKGITTPNKFNKYPYAIVSSRASELRSMDSVKAGFPSLIKEIKIEFDIYIYFDANLDINNQLIDSEVEKIKANVIKVDQTIIEMISALQANTVRVLLSPSYIDVTEVYRVNTITDGATQKEIVYGISGHASYKADFTSNYKNRQDFCTVNSAVLVDGIAIKGQLT